MAKPPKSVVAEIAPNKSLRQPVPPLLDTTKLEHIISALEYLHGQAALTGCEEIRTIVESTFKTVLAAYCLILRAGAQEAAQISPS
jgi:hypothetical protein